METLNNVATDTVFKGTGVVSGVRYAKAVWISPRPELPQAGEVIEESLREAEFERFTTAADVVAKRLLDRSQRAEGAASEVLKATAGMVNDRGWRKAVKKAHKVATRPNMLLLQPPLNLFRCLKLPVELWPSAQRTCVISGTV